MMVCLRWSVRHLFTYQLIVGTTVVVTLMFLHHYNTALISEIWETIDVNRLLRSPEFRVNGTSDDIVPQNSLIRFEPVPHDKVPNNSTYDNVAEFPCRRKERLKPYDVEDLMCKERPKYLPQYKNPCFMQGTTLMCAPYYLLLGFEKCGTTDFYKRLIEHPYILVPIGDVNKETRYWSWKRYGLGMRLETIDRHQAKPLFQDYLGFFVHAARNISKNSGSSSHLIVGDATPVDVWQSRGWPDDPQNFGESEPKVLIPHLMRHMLKDPKFFILMREPVERLYSDYIFVFDGSSAKEFDHHVPIALEIFNNCLRNHSTRWCFYSHEMHQKVPMRLFIGCYSVYLRDWFSVFQRHHFFIRRTEDYEKDIAGTIQAAYSFLGVDTQTDKEIYDIAGKKRLHATDSKKSAGTMSSETRRLLEDFYAPCNRDLAELLGDSRFLWEDVKRKRT